MLIKYITLITTLLNAVLNDGAPKINFLLQALAAPSPRQFSSVLLICNPCSLLPTLILLMFKVEIQMFLMGLFPFISS